MERFNMALIPRKKKPARRNQRGMTLIELMIAMVVLLVGVVGSMSLVALSIGGNGRSRQQSNSTAVAQMLTEKISSVKASTSPVLLISDCAGANFAVNTALGGSALLASGDVDFTQAAVPGYQVLYTDCGNGDASGRQTTYDVRWSIQASGNNSAYLKFLTVSARKQNAGNDLKFFSLPVTIRTLIGQGT